MNNPDHFYKDSVVVYSSPTINKFGEKTDGSGTSTVARFVERNFVIKDKFGKEVQCDGLVHVKPTITVNIDNTITFSGRTFDVLAVKKAKDGDGNIRHQRLAVKLRT